MTRLRSSAANLAEPFDMALPSFLQHLDVLEDSGLVRSSMSGRVRTYQLSPGPLQAAGGWMAEQRRRWECRLDQLDWYLAESKPVEKPKSATSSSCACGLAPGRGSGVVVPQSATRTLEDFAVLRSAIVLVSSENGESVVEGCSRRGGSARRVPLRSRIPTSRAER